MAHTQGSTGRVQRLTSLLAMLAVSAAVALAFGRVFEGGNVPRVLFITGAATAVVAWAFERRSLFLTTIAEVGVLVLLLGVLVFRDATWHLLPSLETLRAIGDAAGQVGEQARLQAAPAPPVTPLVFATVAAVWAAVFSCHALAFRAGSPMLALIPPGALIVFADSVLDDLIRPIYGLWFLAAALAVLFADSLRRMQGWGPVWGGPGRSDRMLPGAGRNARTVAVAALAVAVVAPFIMPGFGGRAAFDITDIGRDDGVAVSALVSMSSELNSGEAKPVFRVSSEVASYWRMTALERFDGVTWAPSEATAVPVVPGEPLPGAVGGTPTTQTFTLTNDLLFPWLPSTYRPTGVDVPGTASWNLDTDTLLVDEPLHEGDTYMVTSAYVAPSVEELRAAEVTTGDPLLTQLPPATPPSVEELARSLTEGLESPYDQAMAIQDALTGFDYEYDTEVAYREDIQSIADFLIFSRKGFCQQFATGMAVLLRSIGIPARVAVGFARGTTQPDGSWDVTTDDLHTWVEVPFEGYGWLSFEPTKTRIDPIGSVYNAPELAEVCPRGGCGPDGRPTTTSGSLPTPAIEFPNAGPFIPVADQRSTPERWGRSYGPWVVGVLLLALGTWLVVRWRRRRAALTLAGRAPREAIVTTYRTFTRRAGAAGAARIPGETPEEYRARLGTMLDDRSPLDRLTDLTVSAAYSPREPTTDDALDALADADEAVREVKRLGGRRWSRRARAGAATG